MKTTYIDPLGRDFEDPSLDMIRQHLLLGGREYWEAGSASAALRWNEDDQNRGAELYLIVAPTEGVVVRYCEASGEDEFVLLTSEESAGAPVSTFPGGDEWIVPRRFLSRNEQALRAIEVFLSSGERVAGAWHVLGTEDE